LLQLGLRLIAVPLLSCLVTGGCCLWSHAAGSQLVVPWIDLAEPRLWLPCPSRCLQHMVSIVWGFGQLSALCKPARLPRPDGRRSSQSAPGDGCHPAHERFLDAACAALSDVFSDPTVTASHWATGECGLRGGGSLPAPLALARRPAPWLAHPRPAGGAVLQPADLTDMACGLAAAQLRSSASARLLNCIAAEVHTQLSNR